MYFTLARAADLRVRILDLRGRVVRTRFDGRLGEGPQTLAWDGRDRSGRPVAAGTSFVRMVVDGRAVTRKVSVVR